MWRLYQRETISEIGNPRSPIKLSQEIMSQFPARGSGKNWVKTMTTASSRAAEILQFEFACARYNLGVINWGGEKEPRPNETHRTRTRNPRH